MECSVYDRNLSRIGVISTWVSLIWEENYNDVGSFQLSVIQIDGIADILKPDYYVGISESDTLMIIKSVQIIDTNIVADGYSITNIFSDRVSTEVVSNENAEKAMRRIVENMEPWPNLYLGNLAGINDVFKAQKSDDNVLNYLKSISIETDIGFKLRYDNVLKKLFFECYKPSKNANLKFSTLYGNMGNVGYSSSTSNFKNVAVVAGAGEGDKRITVIAGDVNSEGINRREIYIDARQEQIEEGETEEEYRNRLIRYGEEKLIGRTKIENFKFEIQDERVKLGDVVTCKMPEIGVELEVRINGITRTSRRNENTIEASVGTPIRIRRY